MQIEADDHQLETFFRLVRKLMSEEWENFIRSHVSELEKKGLAEQLAQAPVADWVKFGDRPDRHRADILFSQNTTLELKLQQIAESVANLRRENAQLEEALSQAISLVRVAFQHWDNDEDMKVGKILKALSGELPGYMQQADAIHQVAQPLISNRQVVFSRHY